MLRLKYYSLNKEEKQKLKNEFYNTEFGKSINNRLNRLLLVGVIGILFSVYLFIAANGKWDYVYASILVIASLIFIIGSFKIRIDKLNQHLVSKKK